MDAETLIFANLLTAFSLAVMFSILAFFRKETSVRWFAFSYIMIMAGNFVYMVPIAPSVLQIIQLLATNLILFCSYFMQNAAYRSFLMLRAWPRRNWFYFAVLLSSSWYFTAMIPSYMTRAVIFSLLSILVFGDLFFSVRSGNQPGNSNLRALILLLCAEYSLVHLIRILLLLQYSRGSVNWVENNVANLFMPAATLINLTIWATVLLLLEFNRSNDLLKSKNAALESLAITDPLTGLRNRNDLSKSLDHLIETANRYEEPISIILIDFDYFKSINDRLGHDVGDRVLRASSALFAASLRSSDLAYRWGGEEFLIVLPHTSLEGAREVAEKLRVSIETAVIEGVGPVTASFGVATHLRYEAQEIWFKRVDLCLYRAKQRGRNLVVCWEENEALPLSMVRMEWQKRWNCGNPIIDKEHQELLNLGNQLIDLQLSLAPPSEIVTLLTKLGDHLNLHFQHEEEILSQLGYPELASHRKEHKELLDTVAAMRPGGDTSQDLTSIFHLVMGKIIIGHLLTDDVAYFDLIHSRN